MLDLVERKKGVIEGRTKEARSLKAANSQQLEKDRYRKEMIKYVMEKDLQLVCFQDWGES